MKLWKVQDTHVHHIAAETNAEAVELAAAHFGYDSADEYREDCGPIRVEWADLTKPLVVKLEDPRDEIPDGYPEGVVKTASYSIPPNCFEKLPKGLIASTCY